MFEADQRAAPVGYVTRLSSIVVATEH